MLAFLTFAWDSRTLFYLPWCHSCLTRRTTDAYDVLFVRASHNALRPVQLGGVKLVYRVNLCRLLKQDPFPGSYPASRYLFCITQTRRGSTGTSFLLKPLSPWVRQDISTTNGSPVPLVQTLSHSFFSPQLLLKAPFVKTLVSNASIRALQSVSQFCRAF